MEFLGGEGDGEGSVYDFGPGSPGKGNPRGGGAIPIGNVWGFPFTDIYAPVQTIFAPPKINLRMTKNHAI